MFIAEVVLPEQGEKANAFEFLLDLEMMVLCSGKERTLKEYSNLLDASGWKFLAKHDTGSPLQLIEAVKI